MTDLATLDAIEYPPLDGTYRLIPPATFTLYFGP